MARLKAKIASNYTSTLDGGNEFVSLDEGAALLVEQVDFVYQEPLHKLLKTRNLEKLVDAATTKHLRSHNANTYARSSRELVKQIALLYLSVTNIILVDWECV
ncbi:hypothetical protein DXG03_006682 [Asterophora parasitica]|uniref:Uncharacterized protein n=1 Tax=Asterophora parasitica TaxID=117018 RepID=A0A9P7K3C9_9AGAR|nr:hypothetical protein DXG03_006682 [Asterophora parasitica]